MNEALFTFLTGMGIGWIAAWSLLIFVEIRKHHEEEKR